MTDRCMRVFTVASESRYIVVRNVPALGVIDDLLKRLSLYGKVCEYRLLDHADDRQEALQFEESVDNDDEFTDTVWVQYETVNNARHAKIHGVQKPFYGNRLQISYAPQFESQEDTADKLAQRRKLLLLRARPSAYHAERNPVTATSNNKRHISCTSSLPAGAANNKTHFIGPLLPSRSQHSVPELPRIPSNSQHPPPAVARQQQNTKRRRI